MAAPQHEQFEETDATRAAAAAAFAAAYEQPHVGSPPAHQEIHHGSQPQPTAYAIPVAGHPQVHPHGHTGGSSAHDPYSAYPVQAPPRGYSDGMGGTPPAYTAPPPPMQAPGAPSAGPYYHQGYHVPAAMPPAGPPPYSVGRSCGPTFGGYGAPPAPPRPEPHRQLVSADPPPHVQQQRQAAGMTGGSVGSAGGSFNPNAAPGTPGGSQAGSTAPPPPPPPYTAQFATMFPPPPPPPSSIVEMMAEDIPGDAELIISQAVSPLTHRWYEQVQVWLELHPQQTPAAPVPRPEHYGDVMKWLVKLTAWHAANFNVRGRGHRFVARPSPTTSYYQAPSKSGSGPAPAQRPSAPTSAGTSVDQQFVPRSYSFAQPPAHGCSPVADNRYY